MGVLDLQVIDPLSFEKWDDTVLSFDEVSFFHSTFWARLLKESYGFTPRYCVALDNGRLEAAIPFMEVRGMLGDKKGVSLPFSDFCAPLYRDKDGFKKVFEFTLETARKNKWKMVMLRGNAPFERDIPASDSYFRHLLSLKADENALFKSFRESTKRNIKKAVTSKVRVSFEATFDAMREFYRINCLARRDHGLPPQPFSFFRNLYRIIIEEGHGEVALATVRGKPVSASVFLHYGTVASYKYGASDRRMSDTRANYLVMWEAIRRYRAKGSATFCFGRTESNHKGLLQFKTGWGTEQLEIRNYAFDVRKGAFVHAPLKTSGLHNLVFRCMPIPALKLVGRLLYRFAG